MFLPEALEEICLLAFSSTRGHLYSLVWAPSSGFKASQAVASFCPLALFDLCYCRLDSCVSEPSTCLLEGPLWSGPRWIMQLTLLSQGPSVRMKITVHFAMEGNIFFRFQELGHWHFQRPLFSHNPRPLFYHNPRKAVIIRIINISAAKCVYIHAKLYISVVSKL